MILCELLLNGAARLEDGAKLLNFARRHPALGQVLFDCAVSLLDMVEGPLHDLYGVASRKTGDVSKKNGDQCTQWHSTTTKKTLPSVATSRTNSELAMTESVVRGSGMTPSL